MEKPVDMRSILKKILNRLAYNCSRLLNDPYQFPHTEKGTPVGDTLEVHWLAFHDMALHQIDGALTKCLLIDGRKFNAYHIIATHRVARNTNLSIIQPLWVEESPQI